MFIVYILKSLKNGKRYIGSTSKSIEDRIHEHNTGSNKFTRENAPFVLLRTEEFEIKTKAFQREFFLKSTKGFLEKKKIIENL